MNQGKGRTGQFSVSIPNVKHLSIPFFIEKKCLLKMGGAISFKEKPGEDIFLAILCDRFGISVRFKCCWGPPRIGDKKKVTLNHLVCLFLQSGR